MGDNLRHPHRKTRRIFFYPLQAVGSWQRACDLLGIDILMMCLGALSTSLPPLPLLALLPSPAAIVQRPPPMSSCTFAICPAQQKDEKRRRRRKAFQDIPLAIAIVAKLSGCLPACSLLLRLPTHTHKHTYTYFCIYICMSIYKYI